MSVRSTYKMRNRCLLMSILAVASSAMLATSTFAAEAGATEHEGVSLKPQMLVQFGGFGITNSMLVTWFGLIPGIGTIGWGHYDPSGNFHVDRPLLRGGNADLNMTTAMSAIFFVMWFVWAIQANGVGGFLKHLFGPKGETTGIVKILMIVIFFAV